MTNQGPPEPDETQPFASQGQQWPSYEPNAGGGEQPPAAPSGPPPPYGPPPTSQQPTYDQPAYGQASYGQGGYPPPPPQQPYGYAPPGYTVAQKNSTATTSMVLGIIAVVSILATPVCCITLPGMLTGPFAIWTGVKSKREIDQHPGYYGNRGQAVAGLVTGIVATVLAVLIVILVVVFVLATDWDGSYDQGMY